MTTFTDTIVKNNESYTIITSTSENIVKESEKAICLEITVTYSERKSTRNQWFPKSVISTFGSRYIVKSWFYAKTARENAFKGWQMDFSESLGFDADKVKFNEAGAYVEC